MTSGTVPFKEGTVPCLQPQGGFLREQEGFCTLQKQPGENTDRVGQAIQIVVVDLCGSTPVSCS